MYSAMTNGFFSREASSARLRDAWFEVRPTVFPNQKVTSGSLLQPLPDAAGDGKHHPEANGGDGGEIFSIPGWRLTDGFVCQRLGGRAADPALFPIGQ